MNDFFASLKKKTADAPKGRGKKRGKKGGKASKKGGSEEQGSSSMEKENKLNEALRARFDGMKGEVRRAAPCFP